MEGQLCRFILIRDPGPVEYVPYSKDRFAAVVACLNGGNVLAHFVDTLQRWMIELGAQTLTQDHIWAKIMAMEEDSDANANTVEGASMEVVPTLFGERHEPDAHASVTNISINDLSLGRVIQSLCQGLTLSC